LRSAPEKESSPRVPASTAGAESEPLASAAAVRRLFGLGPTPVDATAAPEVGAIARPDIELKPLPPEFARVRPYFGDLRYFISGDRAVLVFPATRRIVMTY
jgi:hypothetical protein